MTKVSEKKAEMAHKMGKHVGSRHGLHHKMQGGKPRHHGGMKSQLHSKQGGFEHPTQTGSRPHEGRGGGEEAVQANKKGSFKV